MVSANVERVADWTATLAAGVSNPPTPEQGELHAFALAIACRDLPATAFCRASQIAALRTFANWPGVASLYSFLREGFTGTSEGDQGPRAAPSPISRARDPRPPGSNARRPAQA